MREHAQPERVKPTIKAQTKEPEPFSTHGKRLAAARAKRGRMHVSGAVATAIRKPAPTMYLEDDAAEPLMGRRVGEPTTLTVHGRIGSMSASRGFDGKVHRSVSVEAHAIHHAAARLGASRLGSVRKGRGRGYDNSLGHGEYPGNDPANVPGNYD